MNTAAATQSTTTLVADARAFGHRHHTVSAWCLVLNDDFVSYMPTIKHQRPKEPSQR
jgi:hypothetical protein